MLELLLSISNIAIFVCGTIYILYRLIQVNKEKRKHAERIDLINYHFCSADFSKIREFFIAQENFNYELFKEMVWVELSLILVIMCL